MSVELLLRKIDNPGDDDGLSWKRGDIVAVREAGHAWGTQESPPSNFLILTVTAVDVAQVRELLEAQQVDGGGALLRLRLRRLDTGTVPAGIMTVLEQTGYHTQPWAAVRNWIRNQSTGLPDLPEIP